MMNDSIFDMPASIDSHDNDHHRLTESSLAESEKEFGFNAAASLTDSSLAETEQEFDSDSGELARDLRLASINQYKSALN